MQHGQRADAIVKNMLLHSREGSGEHRPIDINALVEEASILPSHGARAETQDFEVTFSSRSIRRPAEQTFSRTSSGGFFSISSLTAFMRPPDAEHRQWRNYQPTVTAVTQTSVIASRSDSRQRDWYDAGRKREDV